MPQRRIKRALISVYDKTGIVDFARALVGEFGVEIISTGGTAKLLKESGIPVTLVEDITGFPEMLDGRVKTLHPKIHAAILADRDNPEHMRQLKEQGIEPIDMVVVNLYPFEETVKRPDCTFEEAIEMIDIGGPCLLRAAAKNHKHVVVVDPVHAASVLERLRSHDTSLEPVLALNAFFETACYDSTVGSWLAERFDGASGVQLLELSAKRDLRYGENPHQSGAVCALSRTPLTDEAWITGAAFREGQAEISFNNFADSHAALELCKELTRENPSYRVSLFTKHTNPCGVGLARDPVGAYRKAYLGDASAAMGGVLVCNFKIGADFARGVMETLAQLGKEAGAGAFFVEVWVAPTFDETAVQVIRTGKKWGERVRLLSVGGDMGAEPDARSREYKSIIGGMLVQTRDLVGLNEDQWKVVTKREPTEPEMSDLRLAWLIAKHTKSNAISICKDGMLIGNGAGQMSRVMSCRVATWLARDNGHAEKLKGAAAASDAFFPFADGPKLLIDAGVSAIIQPGGSKRDEEVIAGCNERDVAMIFTGTRHFKH